MAAELLRSGLPYSWTYGVTNDGRIFFIDDENRRTTWLHPRDREPVQTGYRPLRELPAGWEQGVTPEGALYYIDHTTHSTTFVHPITKETVAADINLGNHDAPSIQRSPPSKTHSVPQSPQSPYHPDDLSPTQSQDSRRNTLKKSPGKPRVVDRHPSVKGDRRSNAEVTMKGWLNKQDHTGPLKNWKQRWCVLADFCLFFYKDSTELHSYGSILLPSYNVCPCDKDDGVSKKYAFKVEHDNMQTYYFAAETETEMQRWLNALSLATVLRRDPSDDQGPPQLPNGPTADKFINYPARQVDENDNSVLGGNDPDDFGFAHERYNPHRNMQESYSDSYPSRGQGDQDWDHRHDYRDRDPGYAGDPRFAQRKDYDERERNDPHTHSYQGQSPEKDYGSSYSERGYDSFPRGASFDPNWRVPDDSYTDLGHDPYRDRTRPQNEIGYAYSPDQGHESDRSFPNQRSDDRGADRYGSLSYEPEGRFVTHGDRGSYSEGQRLQSGDRDIPNKPSFGEPPVEKPWIPETYPQTSSMQRTSNFPDLSLRSSEPKERQSLLREGDDDSVFTDRSQQKAVVPDRASVFQSLNRGHQKELSRQNDTGKLNDSFERKDTISGARYSNRGLDQLDSGQYPNSGRSPQFDQKENCDPLQSSRHPSNSPNQIVHTSPKQSLDLSIDTRSTEHIYENISSFEGGGSHNASYDTSNMPNRPPLPAHYRDQIIRELAQTKTPNTRQDFMDAAENEVKRYNQPTFFQFPESPPSTQKEVPDSYYEARQRVDNLEGQPFQGEKDDQGVQGKRFHDERKGDPVDKRTIKKPASASTDLIKRLLAPKPFKKTENGSKPSPMAERWWRGKVMAIARSLDTAIELTEAERIEAFSPMKSDQVDGEKRKRRQGSEGTCSKYGPQDLLDRIDQISSDDESVKMIVRDYENWAPLFKAISGDESFNDDVKIIGSLTKRDVAKLEKHVSKKIRRMSRGVLKKGMITGVVDGPYSLPDVERKRSGSVGSELSVESSTLSERKWDSVIQSIKNLHGWASHDVSSEFDGAQSSPFRPSSPNLHDYENVHKTESVELNAADGAQSCLKGNQGDSLKISSPAPLNDYENLSDLSSGVIGAQNQINGPSHKVHEYENAGRISPAVKARSGTSLNTLKTKSGSNDYEGLNGTLLPGVKPLNENRTVIGAQNQINVPSHKVHEYENAGRISPGMKAQSGTLNIPKTKSGSNDYEGWNGTLLPGVKPLNENRTLETPSPANTLDNYEHLSDTLSFGSTMAQRGDRKGHPSSLTSEICDYENLSSSGTMAAAATSRTQSAKSRLYGYEKLPKLSECNGAQSGLYYRLKEVLKSKSETSSPRSCGSSSCYENLSGAYSGDCGTKCESPRAQILLDEARTAFSEDDTGSVVYKTYPVKHRHDYENISGSLPVHSSETIGGVGGAQSSLTRAHVARCRAPSNMYKDHRRDSGSRAFKTTSIASSANDYENFANSLSSTLSWAKGGLNGPTCDRAVKVSRLTSSANDYENFSNSLPSKSSWTQGGLNGPTCDRAVKVSSLPTSSANDYENFSNSLPSKSSWTQGGLNGSTSDRAVKASSLASSANDYENFSNSLPSKSSWTQGGLNGSTSDRAVKASSLASSVHDYENFIQIVPPGVNGARGGRRPLQTSSPTNMTNDVNDYENASLSGAQTGKRPSQTSSRGSDVYDYENAGAQSGRKNSDDFSYPPDYENVFRPLSALDLDAHEYQNTSPKPVKLPPVDISFSSSYLMPNSMKKERFNLDDYEMLPSFEEKDREYAESLRRSCASTYASSAQPSFQRGASFHNYANIHGERPNYMEKRTANASTMTSPYLWSEDEVTQTEVETDTKPLTIPGSQSSQKSIENVPNYPQDGRYNSLGRGNKPQPGSPNDNTTSYPQNGRYDSIGRGNHPQYSSSNDNVPSSSQDGRYDSLGRGNRPPFQPSSEPIHTIKEDPTMGDDDILETKYRSLRKTYSVTPLNGHKLRLSIQESDLEGKSHEELVLLLIQLRREQSKLERNRDSYRKLVEQRKEQERLYRTLKKASARLDDSMEEDHEQFVKIKYKLEDLEKHLEVHKPLVNLVDNMVKMGSLYSGSTDMLVSQYKKHLLSPEQVTPPKKMLEFTRQLQEDKLVHEHKEELKNLNEEEIDFEEKMQQLHQLDRELQELSVMVTSLQDDKKMLDRAIQEVEQDQYRYKDDPREMERLTQEHKVLERQLSHVVHQLAEHSRILEEVTAENSRAEMEVTMLRSKVADISKSSSMPTLSSESYRTKVKLESELNKVQGIMDGLSKQGQQLSEAMDTLRKSNPDLTASGSKTEKHGTYLETDMDTLHTRDIAIRTSTSSPGFRRSYSERDSSRGSREDLYRSDTETDQSFQSRDRSKSQTVRDVKRESERRSRGRDPTPRFGPPPKRSQSLPRNLERSSKKDQDIIHPQSQMFNFSSPQQKSPYDMTGSSQTLPTRGKQAQSDADVLRQAAINLSRQNSRSKSSPPMQRKTLSSSFEVLDRPAAENLKVRASVSHEILNQPDSPASSRRYPIGQESVRRPQSVGGYTSSQQRMPEVARQLSYPSEKRNEERQSGYKFSYPQRQSSYSSKSSQQAEYSGQSMQQSGLSQHPKEPEYLHGNGKRTVSPQDVSLQTSYQSGHADEIGHPDDRMHKLHRYNPDDQKQSSKQSPGYHFQESPRQPSYRDQLPRQPSPKGAQQEQYKKYSPGQDAVPKQQGYQDYSPRQPDPLVARQQSSQNKYPWQPKVPGDELGEQANYENYPPEKPLRDDNRRNKQNGFSSSGKSPDPVSVPIAHAKPAGYGTLDDRPSGYGSLDRMPAGYGSLDRRRDKSKDVPRSPETDIKQPFYPTQPEQASYQQSAFKPPSSYGYDSSKPKYQEAKPVNSRYHEIIQPKTFQPVSASQTSLSSARATSPKGHAKFPSDYSQSPTGSRTDSPRGYQSDSSSRGYRPIEYRPPTSSTGSTKESTQKEHYKPSYMNGSSDKLDKKPQRSPMIERKDQKPYEAPLPLRQGYPHQAESSPQLRRSATLPVKSSTEKRSDRPTSASERLFSQGRTSTSSHSPLSSTQGTPQRVDSPRSYKQKDSPRLSGEAKPRHAPEARPRQMRDSAPEARSRQMRDVVPEPKPRRTMHTNSQDSETARALIAQYRPDEVPRRDSKGRFQTIASSQPAKMEYSYEDEEESASASDKNLEDDEDAELRRKARKKPRQYSFDDTTIDREVLFSPDKVDIPERYIPEEDEEELTEEERMRREKKVERIRKLLSAQSLQDWTKSDMDDHMTSIHKSVKAEKKRREMVLEMREKLAKQVTVRSKQVAAEANKKQRRQTWSGGSAKRWDDIDG